jgi:hypothetical protein
VQGRWPLDTASFSFFLVFGLAKFTCAEAVGIHPLLVHSPFLFWLPRLFDLQLSSEILALWKSVSL